MPSQAAMRHDPISGVSIIVGSLLAVLVMALHPVGGDLQRDFDYLVRAAPVAFWVHVLALVSIAILAFGIIGLSRSLNPESALVRAGFVSLIISLIAVFGASVAGGILPASIVELYPQLDPTERSAMEVVWRVNGLVNQALAKVWVVGTSIGVLLWSPVTWRRDLPWKIASALGVAMASIGLITLLTGQLRLNVTGTSLFVAGFVFWAVLVGSLLCRKLNLGEG